MFSGFRKNINYETFEQFSIRVKHTLENTPPKYIDKGIESMPKRMLMVIKSKGQRIKYLKAKLKAKFDLYRFIPTKTVCLEIPSLNLRGIPY